MSRMKRRISRDLTVVSSIEMWTMRSFEIWNIWIVLKVQTESMQMLLGLLSMIAKLFVADL